VEFVRSQEKKSMKKTFLGLALVPALGLMAGAAFAQSFLDDARVVSVRALTERIPVSREECWNDRQRGYEERRVVRSDTGAAIGPGTILGAVVGGVIGHQFGNSSGGRDRATAAGAIVGGLVGNQVDRDQGNVGEPRESVQVERVPVERNVERCRTVNEVREATTGYDVRYEYSGRQFTTRLPYDPGPNLEVRVDVSPNEPVPRPGSRPGPRPPAYSR
jgi:uncharacterized protein YcfJ